MDGTISVVCGHDQQCMQRLRSRDTYLTAISQHHHDGSGCDSLLASESQLTTLCTLHSVVSCSFSKFLDTIGSVCVELNLTGDVFLHAGILD